MFDMFLIERWQTLKLWDSQPLSVNKLNYNEFKLIQFLFIDQDANLFIAFSHRDLIWAIIGVFLRLHNNIIIHLLLLEMWDLIIYVSNKSMH